VRVSVVGIPDSSRLAYFRAAMREAGLPDPDVVSWVDALDGAMPPGLVRLETPGRNWNTERRLLALGADEVDEEDADATRYTRLTAEEVAACGEPAGRIVAMRQWHLGWRRGLRALRARRPAAEFFSPPEDVACLFDKELCQRRLEAAGCAMPQSLGTPRSFDDLLERMRASRCARVFLKACHGSSASGVVALETSRGRVQAFSTARCAAGALWNTRPGSWLRELPAIAMLVDAVCRQRAQAQAWVPKLGWHGRRLDLRIVTIAGRARHVVVRLSRTPLTNLQLRNARGDLEAFAAAHGPALAAARAQAELAAAAFPRSLALGVDVALSRDGRAWVLEANAFGDLLPGCLAHGWDTYRWQVEALRERMGIVDGRSSSWVGNG
jgi:hypothetical protein